MAPAPNANLSPNSKDEQMELFRYNPVTVGSSLQLRSVAQRSISGHVDWTLT